MITYEVIGLKPYSFTDSVSNKLIQGHKFFCIYEENTDEQCEGLKTISFNVSRAKLGTYLPKVGDKIYVSWVDKRNFKVDYVEKVSTY